MQRRDRITLGKILVAIDEAVEILKSISKEEFLTSNILS